MHTSARRRVKWFGGPECLQHGCGRFNKLRSSNYRRFDSSRFLFVGVGFPAERVVFLPTFRLRILSPVDSQYVSFASLFPGAEWSITQGGIDKRGVAPIVSRPG